MRGLVSAAGGLLLATIVLACGCDSADDQRRSQTGEVPEKDRSSLTLDQPEWLGADVSQAEPEEGARFVSVDGDDAAPGSREAPWGNLQTALCRLQPGDHLYVLPGNRRGPVVIGQECADGTVAAPIRVTAVKDAVLGNERGDEPVLRVARSHWHLKGFEIVPDWSTGPGLVVEAPAEDVVVDTFHVHKGVGTGIVIASQTRGITIRRSHIHHLGLERGPPGERADLELAGIEIEPGAESITLSRNNLHSIRGEALSMATESKSQVTLKDNRIQHNPPR